MLAAVVVAAWFATSIAPRSPGGDRLVAGPVLAGDEVVWATEGGGELSVRSGSGLLYRHPRERDRTSFWVDGLGGSSSVVAFRLEETFCPPSEQIGPNQWIGYACRSAQSTLAGSGSRPFTSISSSACGEAGPDVEGDVVALLEANCGPDERGRVVLRTSRGETVAIPHDGQTVPSELRIAGRYVAWSSGSTIVVYDWRAATETYRVDVAAQTFGTLRFDLQDDGKLAVAYEVGADVPFTKIVWYSQSRRAGRYVANAPYTSPEVRIARDRIVYETTSETRGRALVVTDLDGESQELARFGAATRRVGTIDFDGTRVTWAAAEIARQYSDCPPAGSGIRRPCTARYDGAISIWKADLTADDGAPRRVATHHFAWLWNPAGLEFDEFRTAVARLVAG